MSDLGNFTYDCNFVKYCNLVLLDTQMSQLHISMHFLCITMRQSVIIMVCILWQNMFHLLQIIKFAQRNWLLKIEETFPLEKRSGHVDPL